MHLIPKQELQKETSEWVQLSKRDRGGDCGSVGSPAEGEEAAYTSLP